MEELEPTGCDGSEDCSAAWHWHGCQADVGACTEEHQHVIAAETPRLCPICRERTPDPEARKDARGRRWCMPCQDEHDDIDWDKIAEERMGL